MISNPRAWWLCSRTPSPWAAPCRHMPGPQASWSGPSRIRCGANWNGFQVVKGWLDDGGNAHSSIHDVACAPRLTLDPKTSRCRGEPVRVDPANLRGGRVWRGCGAVGPLARPDLRQRPAVVLLRARARGPLVPLVDVGRDSPRRRAARRCPETHPGKGVVVADLGAAFGVDRVAATRSGRGRIRRVAAVVAAGHTCPNPPTEGSVMMLCDSGARNAWRVAYDGGGIRPGALGRPWLHHVPPPRRRGRRRSTS